MCRRKSTFISTVLLLITIILWARELRAWWPLRSSFGTVVRPSPKMDDLTRRLSSLHPSIEKLMKIAGTAGLSLGVVHHGKVIHYANFGYRDVEARLAPTEETIYSGCSLTKALVAATMGMLVEEGKLEWTSLVKEVLPDFHIKDETIREKASMADLLCMRTGFSVADYYLGAENNILVAKKDTVAFISNQEAINPFRAHWQYNNLGYELIGLAIDKVSNSSWANLMRSRILDPLGLKRTFLHYPTKEVDNVAKAYNTLDNATPTQIHPVRAAENNFSGAAASLHTSVKDLLSLYTAFLAAANDQFATGKTSTPNSPFKQVNHLMSTKIPMGEPTLNEVSYAFGWARVQLPGPMGGVGCNPGLMPEGMPAVGKGVPSRLVIYHQGSLPGALSAVNLIPDTQTAVVVMTNSLSLNDCPDWVGQLLLEEIMDVPQHLRNDYLKAAEISASSSLQWYQTVSKELEDNRKTNTTPKHLDTYVGTYWNSIRIMKIVVTLEKGHLFYAVQGLESEKYSLAHYEDDIFTWIQPRNALAKRGRWVEQGAEFWKIKFGTDDHGQVDRLIWVHDLEIPQGEIFWRD